MRLNKEFAFTKKTVRLVTGNRPEMRNHYRGHKMSLWLNLIPQLHRPSDGDETSMRHHHFQEEGDQYYDGKTFKNNFLFLLNTYTFKNKLIRISSKHEIL